MDEIDSIMSARSENENDYTRRIKSLLLIEIGNILDEEGIFFLGSSCLPWDLDHALIAKFQKKIYIKLPDEDNRKKIFQFYLKDTPNTLTEEQYEYLAQKTNYYSGSDISTLCQDAIFGPVRKIQSAEYFKKIPGINGLKYNYTPCDENEPGAIKMKMTDIPEAKALLLPKVEYNDFIEALRRNNGYPNPNDSKIYEKFREEYGE